MSAHSHTDVHATAHGPAGEHNHDKNAPKVYVGVLCTLLVLTFITVAASYINWGSPIVNVIVALTIATIKASLVALFFMHLIHDKPINAIILCSGFAFLGLFLIACYEDTASRLEILPTNLKPPASATATPGAPPAAPGTPQSGAAASPHSGPGTPANTPPAAPATNSPAKGPGH